MCDEALFSAQTAYHSKQREVTVADLTSGASIEAMATEILATAPDKFCFAGLSMGGIVGFELVRQAPERLAGLVLMNTTAEPDTPEKTRARLRQIKRARSGELDAMVLEELKPNYLAERSRKDLALLNEITAMAGRLGESVFERQSRALIGRCDSRELLSKITCPVALVAGEQDILCPPQLHVEMHQAITSSGLHILPECGHLSTLERPNSVNAVLDEVLSRVDLLAETV